MVKKFLFVIIFGACIFIKPIFCMNYTVKVFKNNFSKIKNLYTKMPKTKKNILKYSAFTLTAGVAALKTYRYIYNNDPEKHLFSGAITHESPTIPLNLLEQLPEKKLFSDVIAHQPHTLPLNLLKQLQENPKVLNKAILFYLAHKKEYGASEYNAEAVELWEHIFSQFNIEKLYDMKDSSYFLAPKINQKEPYEIFTSIDNRQKGLINEQKEYAKKITLKEKATDEVSVECRNIALQHGVAMPEWIQFRYSNGFFTDKPNLEIKVSKNKDGIFGFSLAPLNIDQEISFTDDEVAGIVGHELGHIAQQHKYFHNFQREELACDRYVCLQSNKACLGNIKVMSKVIELYRTKLKNDGLTDNQINTNLETFGGKDYSHPPVQKRIKKMHKIMKDIEQEKQGLCKNPFYKQLSSQKWFSCKKP